MVLVKNPSPSRGENAKKNNKRKSRASRGNSPANQTTSRGNSPGKSNNSGVKVVTKSSLQQSRGSETGSIERLVDGDKRVIATKHLLPENNINVVVRTMTTIFVVNHSFHRVRPLSRKEIKAGDDMAVQFPGDGQIYCEGFPSSMEKKGKLFSYNVAFEPTATQEDILQFSGVKKLIEMAVEGFSCTAFCYGQTGSGKTHTLTGPPEMFERMNPYSEQHGLVFRSFVYLFKLLQERQECNFVLKASFLEIYNEKVIDLLNPGTSRKPLMVRWSKKTRGFFVENLFTVECEELDDLLAVLEEGMRNRKVGSHNMNDHSSRSHSILTVSITSEQQMDNSVFISKQGKINFVDLAGSEMTKKTQSEGKTLEEANNINKSLMIDTFYFEGYCIASLSDGKRKGGHIPYRDSKLTKLLADSLAGNGVTLMIACISPAKSNASETLNTLRYAARVKKIRTKPIVVMDPRDALILSLKREVVALQTENEHLRAALHLNENASNAHRSESKKESLTPPVVDLDKLSEMEQPELSQLIHAYITENEALRRENAELYATREQVIRDQELVCRENERLLKKLEDVNSVCCRSPIIPARPTYSAEMLNDNEDTPGATNVWTNPNVEPTPLSSDMIRRGLYRSASSMPEKIQKELDRRRIVGSYNNIAETYKDKSHHRRHNSWDNGNGMTRMSPDQPISPIDINQHKKASIRRTSTVPEERRPSETNDPLGEPVQPTDHSYNESPDSILSGPLEIVNSTPDTAESDAPTAPFPTVSHISSPFGTPESEDHTTRITSKKPKEKEDETTQRAFGSPIPDDEDKPL
ncbi:Kinesin-like protein KIF12 [Melipona quadrifasciata]|uniref:Kinesin-like protein n=1 Tax=Melipona quadrifasciata TaxID=166423 RepID=A0A0N1IT26_9HYME|nr:Kinesin-like protein KIF12 [Melipona quadrifasciata]